MPEGAWDQAALGAAGMTLRALARRADGAWPVRLELAWAGRRVALLLPPPPAPDAPAPAFQALVGLPPDPLADWSDLELSAHWADGLAWVVPPAPAVAQGLLAVARLEGSAAFNALCVNPATRHPCPWLQAHGAARALRLAGHDQDMWLAAAILALYRCIEEGTFPRAAAAEVLERWEAMRPALMAGAAGLTLRWATSLHMAAGHAWLAWGEAARAQREFAAVRRYADRLESWPGFPTNLGRATAAAALLALAEGERDAAAALVEDALPLAMRGLAATHLSNWYGFEEVCAAMAAWQRCFAIRQRLAGGAAAAALPAQAGARLSEVTQTLAGLVARGTVRDIVLS